MRSLKIFALLIIVNTGAWILPQDASAQQVSVSFQLFYDQLGPYGMWVDYPNYGYVWIPNGDPGFTPYATAGHWVFTDDGWTWFSDYPWGWAPFHYGRWDYDDVYGWFWVPDDVWGPAWVSWRRSPGYYGWAPLRPGISISMAFGSGYHERNERWIFVRDRDITRPDIDRRYVNRTDNAAIINRSTVIVNTRKDNNRNATYIAGPDRADVQGVTHTTVNPVAIRDAGQPGQHLSTGELQIYRPQVQKRSGNGRNPAPSKVMRLNDVRPASERNAGNRQPPTINPPKKGQPSQPRTVNPSSSGGKQKQPQNVTPPNKGQPPQPRTVNPPSSRGKERQPQNVSPPSKGQPPQPRGVQPSSSKGKQKQPQNVTPPKKGQPMQPRNVSPPNNKGKERQPQNVAPPKKKGDAQPAQPKTNQDEKKKDGSHEKVSYNNAYVGESTHFS
jgi:hypothetical protein